MTDNAHAPYNFIPLPDRVVQAEPVPNHDRYHPDRHTGYFDVELVTHTPLYIRGMLTEKEATTKEQHRNKSDFFQIDGKPIIPGSSLLGMIRSLMEIISFSKIQPVSDRKLIYRAVGDVTSYGKSYRDMMLGPENRGIVDYPSRKLHGGYLVRNGHEWAIRPAMKFHNESFVFVPVDEIQKAGISINPQTVVDVWVKPVSQRRHHQVQKDAYINLATSTTISQAKREGLERGKLVISGRAPKRKRYPVIFAPDQNQSLISIQPELWKLYEADRDLNRGIATRPLHNDGDPLFYLLEDNNQLVFLGPTMMFRLPPRYSVQDLIPAELKSNSITDMAESIFGRVARDDSDKRTPTASRVSVTDARPVDGQTEFYERVFTPKILGGPKPTTFQHYLEQPQKEETAKSNLKHYAQNARETRIRGHKLYWRQKGITVEQIKEPSSTSQGDTQHTQMSPVKSGVAFTFRVYFENLSDVELGALAWAITLPRGEEHHHQLGMGKPYGMGVVKLHATLHLSNLEARYKNLFAQWNERDNEAHPSESLIEQFEQYICQEIGHQDGYQTIPRIKELLAMLTVHQPMGNRFRYMTIEPNEYRNRPVLPYPTAVLSTTSVHQRQMPVAANNAAQNQSRPTPQPVPKSEPTTGDEIKGKVFSTEGGLWFKPEGFERYEAQIPVGKIVKNRIEGQVVKARVIEVRDGEPIRLICEQIDPKKK